MKRLLIIGAVLAALGLRAEAQEVTLRVHHFLPVKSTIHAKVLVPWEQAVEAQSGGRIDVQLYPSMQLGGKPPQLFDQARDGIVDISWTLLGYTPGRFPIAEVFELPFMSSSATITTTALQAFEDKYLGDELGQVHVLALHAPAAYKIHLVGAPVERISDLEGLKIRAPSRAMTEALTALGASAVGMPAPEVPQALTAGVIDGAVLPWEVAGALRLGEITSSHTELGGENGGMANSVMALVMNRGAYDRLPQDLKAVIDANSGDALAAKLGAAFDAAEDGLRAKIIAAGATVAVIPEERLAAWRAATQPVRDAWVRAMNEAGRDGQAMLDDVRAMLDAAAQ